MEPNQRRRLLWGVLAAVVLAVVVVAGVLILGGDDGGGGGAGSNKEARASAVAELDAKLLAVGDLPAGFSTAPAAGGANASNKPCSVVHRTDKKGRVGTTRAAFSNTAGGRPTQLSEFLSRYKTGATEPIMAKAKALAKDCASFTEKAGGKEVTFKTETLPFPVLLDETAAYKVTSTTADAPAVFDQVFMRSGDTIVVLVHGGTGGVDSALTDQIARKAAEKLAGR